MSDKHNGCSYDTHIAYANLVLFEYLYTYAMLQEMFAAFV